ncbi:TAXI family TRAP transporter solute-binding subunit [Microbacterium protaetiae]|uniref:TAXI family TRAP transporter solute-binding subunit n=1 Tax=Microbacterium protaetiae TaxID=2509458 RepID=A0A4P6EAU6_9MICO|nr:TAXI family TRAP transporter solute-binding subunit [Microbacterium protaetiae]QAY59104.1 TAXI family TRAP transporter solute-binding subunit [Microbacterium protaetiae]
MTGVLLSRRALLLSLVGATAVVLTGCGPGETPTNMRMACGEPGGTYIRFGHLLGSAVVAEGVARSMTAVPTDGSIENIALLRAGDVDLAIALADSAAIDPHGLVSIGRVYQNYLQCIVPIGGPVTAAADLAGRTVSIGAPESGTAETSRRVLDALGLTSGEHAATVVELNLADAVTALQTGRIDALMWSGGIPVPELDRLDGVMPVTLVDLSGAMARLGATSPAYQPTVVPAGMYGLAEPMPTIGVPNFLLSRADLPDAIATALVDILIDDAVRLVPERSAGLQYLTPSSLIDTGAMPLHPAARRRYLERYG